MNRSHKSIISQKIKSALNESEVSQSELAQVIQKSSAYVSNITKGRYVPKIQELTRIADYLKKPVAYFFGEDSDGLDHYLEKAKKWDTLVSLVDRNIQNDFKKDIISIPLLENEKKLKLSYEELISLRNRSPQYVHISRAYIKQVAKYHKPLEYLITVQIFTKNYPEFAITLGDMAVVEPIKDNVVETNGKLFAVEYKNKIGFKKVYKESNKLYFEPINTTPQIGKISNKDQDLRIIGRVIFNMNVQFY